MGYILATSRVDAVALHDCDILTYDRSLLARLIYPVAHPQFSFEFCKAITRVAAINSMAGLPALGRAIDSRHKACPG